MESSDHVHAIPASDVDSNDRPWWGTFALAEGATRRWRIGPVTLWITRARREWRITCERSDNPFDEFLSIAEPVPDDQQATTEATRLRFGFRRTGETIQLIPALPDRALVVRPEAPFHVMPGEAIRLYISSPLWIRIAVNARPLPLCEMPIFRPSDTWFGPPNDEGAVCYASRTTARMEWANLPQLPQRAQSVIRIRNHADTQLVLERLRLPLPGLSLFASPNHRLMTEVVTLERQEDGVLAKLHLGKGPPREASDAAQVAGPREQAERGLLLRAFGGLFS